MFHIVFNLTNTGVKCVDERWMKYSVMHHFISAKQTNRCHTGGEAYLSSSLIHKCWTFTSGSLHNTKQANVSHCLIY